MLSIFGFAGLSVRLRLVGLVTIVLIPALLFGGWLTSHSADSERSLLERNSESKVEQVRIDIEHEIVSTTAMLTVLASSHFILTEDFEAFHRQTLELARRLDAQVVLTDVKTGKQIVNASIPWGQPMLGNIPAQAVEAREETIRSGKPVVSSVFFGRVVKKHVVSVGIPVMRNGEAVYYLAVGIPTDTFAQALENAALPDQWVVTLIDRDNTIVARSERHGEFAGSKLTVDFAGRAEGVEGLILGTDRFGVGYRWAWRRSELTRWFVIVGVPLTVLEAPRKRALATYTVASVSLFAIAFALSFYLGGRLSQSVGEMGIDRNPTREEFSILFESAPNGVLVVDGEGLILLVNERMERNFGYSRDELIGQPVEMLLPERLRGGHGILRRGFNASPEARPMGAGRKLFGRRKDGSEFPIEIGLNPITTRNGTFVMATVVDISMRVLSQKRLSVALTERDDLRRRFMQAQEDERLRLAHELHDQTGQSLTAALLELKTLESQLKSEGRDRARMLRKSMEQMGKTLHRIAWELRPSSIDELGLTIALGNYISDWSQQYAIETDFHCRDEQLDRIADEKRTAIYRIVQEGLTNIAKHARQATSVSIVIDRMDSLLQLTIEDNGPGFEIDPTIETGDERRRGRLGLAGMRERVSLLGGELEIESSAGAGTTIFARIPLDDERLIA
jgi:PAS domain S-box-containing protein